jgi:predicted NAD-dependent protein-ADP-ribosyltransferase YbiA (DUF1768 family)
MAETEEKVITAGPGPGPEASEAPAPEVVEVRLPELPYTKETISEIKRFYVGRAKNTTQYTYTPEGDLEIKEGVGAKGKKKVAAGNILLQTFVPLDPAERALLEEQRMDLLALLDQEYEEENIVLREAWETYRATESIRAVLNSNQRMTEIDAKRSAARSMVRDIILIPNPRVKDILLNQPYEERKMYAPDDKSDRNVVRMCFYTFPAEVEMGKYVPNESVQAEEEQAEEEAGADKANEMLYRQKLKDGRFARIFFDTKSDTNGFLSPMWPVDFTLNNGGGDSLYSSPFQAYEVERVKELGDVELSTTLMKTRSVRTIRLLTRGVKGHPSDAKGLWVKIYTAVYERYPILKAKLLATGSDTLVFADAREGPSAIGLAEKDSGTLDPAKWKGENAVGLAQETVRTRMREGTSEEAPQAQEVVNAVITEEQQAKAKTGAIINARRGGFR